MSAFNRGAGSWHEWNNGITQTTSGTWTVPAGVFRVRIRAVGGGGAGGGSNSYYCGGNGYFLDREMAVTPGQTLTFAIGAGGAMASGNGGNTTITNGTWTITAQGGYGGLTTLTGQGGPGWGAYGIGTPSGGGNGVAGAASVDW